MLKRKYSIKILIVMTGLLTASIASAKWTRITNVDKITFTYTYKAEEGAVGTATSFVLTGNGLESVKGSYTGCEDCGESSTAARKSALTNLKNQFQDSKMKSLFCQLVPKPGPGTTFMVSSASVQISGNHDMNTMSYDQLGNWPSLKEVTCGGKKGMKKIAAAACDPQAIVFEDSEFNKRITNMQNAYKNRNREAIKNALEELKWTAGAANDPNHKLGKCFK